MDKKEWVSILSDRTLEELEQIFLKEQTYIPKMRFVLQDEQTRNFTVQRWCYLGSVDDWVDLKTTNDLAQLAKTYCYHLGRESYFELESPDCTGDFFVIKIK
ncbi:hypothetical protein QUF82_11210 [Thiotrichales bacterium HSG14]|nr:hypothetical protein [Thiotrichales bacterium HSG14]